MRQLHLRHPRPFGRHFLRRQLVRMVRSLQLIRHRFQVYLPEYVFIDAVRNHRM